MSHFRKINAKTLHYLPASAVHPADTYFHFSFANYHDPERMNFGALRVLNDDEVRPKSGFGRHPHQNMEIISYVVSGGLTHWDNVTDVEDTLRRGEAQAISAGAGVWHSEMNDGDEPCRFLQIWVLPATTDGPVRYAAHKPGPAARRNRLLPLVGPLGNADGVPLQVDQDVNVYVSELTDSSVRVTFSVKAGRQAYLNNFEGSLTVAGTAQLGERDTLELVGPLELEFSGARAHFVLIEMPEPVTPGARASC